MYVLQREKNTEPNLSLLSFYLCLEFRVLFWMFV